MTAARRHAPLTVHSADPHHCNDFVRRQALGRVPLFADLDDRALAAIDARCTVSSRDEGQAVHLRGQAAERVFIPVHGAIKISRVADTGEEVLVDIVGRGELLGGLPALGDDTYATTARAVTAVCLLSLDAPGFEWVLSAYPQVARTALKLVGARLRRAHSALEERSVATAEQRIASTLLRLGERLGVERDGALLIDAPLSREDLGSLAGCAPETASRVLARLRRSGLLDRGRRWVAIRDLDALRELSRPGPGPGGR